MAHHILKKADGSEEVFSEIKLARSLKRAGFNPETNPEIYGDVVRGAQQMGSTEDVYHNTLETLKRAEGSWAARYSLKRAVLALGPSGFPFEKFMAEVFRAHGATAVVNDVTLDGRCVTHEVDIVMNLQGKRIGIESKFHNSLGTKTDIKDMLYVTARYEDLASARNAKVDTGCLITNTRFTTHAARFASCKGVPAIGWEYPEGWGIQKLIETAHLHPVTSLTSLNHGDHQALLKIDVVLAKQLRDKPQLLAQAHIPIEKHAAVLEEVAHLIQFLPKEQYPFEKVFGKL
jgi:hypothetical protein